jgi:uncharacterized membrane protein YjdF
VPPEAAMQNKSLQYAWIVIFVVVFIWSGVNPKDYPTWFLEVFPAALGAAFRRRWELRSSGIRAIPIR